jgi:hypothetical protein
LTGFLIWNLDNVFCGTVRHWRRQMGLPWAMVLEGHAWWHLMTGLGKYSPCHLARRTQLTRDFLGGEIPSFRYLPNEPLLTLDSLLLHRLGHLAPLVPRGARGRIRPVLAEHHVHPRGGQGKAKAQGLIGWEAWWTALAGTLRSRSSFRWCGRTGWDRLLYPCAILIDNAMQKHEFSLRQLDLDMTTTPLLRLRRCQSLVLTQCAGSICTAHKRRGQEEERWIILWSITRIPTTRLTLTTTVDCKPLTLVPCWTHYLAAPEPPTSAVDALSPRESSEFSNLSPLTVPQQAQPPFHNVHLQPGTREGTAPTRIIYSSGNSLTFHSSYARSRAKPSWRSSRSARPSSRSAPSSARCAWCA